MEIRRAAERRQAGQRDGRRGSRRAGRRSERRRQTRRVRRPAASDGRGRPRAGSRPLGRWLPVVTVKFFRRTCSTPGAGRRLLPAPAANWERQSPVARCGVRAAGPPVAGRRKGPAGVAPATRPAEVFAKAKPLRGLRGLRGSSRPRSYARVMCVRTRVRTRSVHKVRAYDEDKPPQPPQPPQCFPPQTGACVAALVPAKLTPAAASAPPCARPSAGPAAAA